MISKDERQNEAINKWRNANGKGIITAATGFGSTL